MDKKKAKRIEAGSLAKVSRFGRLFKAGKLKAVGGLMTENTSLVLLKSRKVYHGSEAVVGFWKTLKAQGLVDVKFSVKKNILIPVDLLLSEGSGQGLYMSYDMADYIFGTFEFVFRTKSKAGGDPNFLAVTAHQHPCSSLLDLMVLDY